MKSFIVIVLLLIPGFITCQSEPVVEISDHLCKSKRVDDAETISILFVGNSLTYTNNLPELIRAIGSKNKKSINTETLALPNYALEDHWMDGNVNDLICRGNYDFVVVQQGPSSQADGRSMLIEFGTKLKNVCETRGSQLAFFMVWPSIANYATFNCVIANYTEAARQTESILCPVGEKWKAFIDQHKDYSYYSSDGFHPSLKGSQVAAEVIYTTLITK